MTRGLGFSSPHPLNTGSLQGPHLGDLVFRTQSQGLGSRALDWSREPSSPPLSASSSLLLDPGAQRAESTGWTRVPPGHMHRRSKGHSAKPCCGHQVLLGKLGEGCQRATSWGAEGRPCSGPGPRLLPLKQILRELLGTVLFPNKDAGRGSGFTQAGGPGNPGRGLWRVQVSRQSWAQKP